MTHTQVERTFLQRLHDYEQGRLTPVVDEAFVKAFIELSWEDQCKAMNHIYYIKQGTTTTPDHETLVHKGRLAELYKNWFADQTETWVSAVYQAPNDARYWELSQGKNTVDLDTARMLLDIGP